MKKIYVAGPLGAPNAGRPARIQAAMKAGLELLALGFAPFVPHAWAGACDVAADAAASYEQWMAYDLAWLQACEALLRLPGASPGADREIAEARRIGLPVFDCIGDLVAHARREGWALGRVA